MITHTLTNPSKHTQAHTTTGTYTFTCIPIENARCKSHDPHTDTNKLARAHTPAHTRCHALNQTLANTRTAARNDAPQVLGVDKWPPRTFWADP